MAESYGVTAFLRHYVQAQMGDRESATVHCDGCTACCRAFTQIVLVPQHGDDPTSYQAHLENGLWCLDRGPDGACVYLTESGCGIYARRPYGCRTFDCRVSLLMGTAARTALERERASGGIRPVIDAAWTKFALEAKAPEDQGTLDWFEWRILRGLVETDTPLFTLVPELVAEWWSRQERPRREGGTPVASRLPRRADRL